VVATALATAALIVHPAAQQSSGRQLTADDFRQAAPRGFGDRSNSWAQSMVWWRGNLYVGTARESLCTSLFALWHFASGVIGREFADTYLPYPPHDPDLPCVANGADLPIQAEIWRWTPGIDTWTRSFQSPLELDNPGPPPQPGKKLPYDIAFRGLAAHTDPDGTEALYAFGVNSTVMWDGSKLPPPRILRSSDGLTFTPISQTPGTFLGDLPFNPDHSSFRSPVSFNGKLFVLSGPIFGQGSLIGSADPANGDNAWFLASPPGQLFYETAVFNGWLYLGTYNPVGGYSVIKTRAEGPPPYQFVTVIPPGAYLTVRPSGSVVSMHEYEGRLYVGTATFTEIVRLNADDTWDLVIGQPRQVPAPGGGTEWKYPLSGLDVGFGHTLNDHAWQMDDIYKNFYVGTYNGSVGSKNDPVNGPLLAHNMGAHLYRTNDGWYYNAVTTNGFADPADPFGGKFDYGIRTMASTPHGAFFGTANDYYGLAIFRAMPRGPDKPRAPGRLEIEAGDGGNAVLSWESVPGAKLYRVWRAERLPILVRADLNFEAWNGVSGNLVPDVYIGPYQQIGETAKATFVDTTVGAGKRYMYYVTAVHHEWVSEQSNLVAFPLLTPPVTFAQLLRDVDRLDQRGRFRSARKGADGVRGQLLEAQALAASCRIGGAIKAILPQKASTALLDPESVDLEILLSKLERRLELYRDMPDLVSSNEFCTSPGY
jgi:hypothetical protein